MQKYDGILLPSRMALAAAVLGAFFTGSTVRAQVNVTLELTDPGNQYADYHDDIERVFLAAAREWTDRMLGSAELEIEVIFQSEGQALMFSAANVGVLSGEFEGSDVYQWGTIYEILSGEDPNGDEPDGLIGINPDYLDMLWFDPAPGADNTQVPNNLYDAYSVVLHEYGHVFAFNGWLTLGNPSAVPIPAIDETPTPIFRPRGILKCGNPGCRPQSIIPDAGQSWVSMNGFMSHFDTHIQGDASGDPHFVGPNVAALFANGVPHDADSYTHINIPGSVMYTYAFPGVRDQVTETELAVLADCDVPVSGSSTCQTGSDSDGDGIDNCVDVCPNDPLHVDADFNGIMDCIVSPCGDFTDTDGDGYQDCVDACPENPSKIAFGECGCDLCPGEEIDENIPNPNDDGEVVLGERPETPMGGAGCGAGAVSTEMLLMAMATLMFLKRRN